MEDILNIDHHKKRLVIKALKNADSLYQAAKLLETSINNLQYLIKKYNLTI